MKLRIMQMLPFQHKDILAKNTVFFSSCVSLNGAKNRLKKYDVKYIFGDFSLLEFEKKQDIIISVIGIHHQKTNKIKKIM